ncbi:MAG TPA: flagellar assembly peptidoglycan hydrolase FlgJ [Rhodanobacteraceae bacterium]|nr:flagellar assembly peptidoglycan hydrolase FlgJ [Oleiagrimonas sp.]HET9819541.1 flagellar assembly peptidoglycan hydrolase FlgJ [Rhodanobacteraceae bacterium]
MDAPRLPVRGPDTWTDIQGLSGLARAARDDGKAALPTVARQFEAVFARMLIKSMRQASFGGGILDSAQSDQWRGMFDNQLALSLANDGKGLGIAAMLVRQLGGNAQGSATATTDPTALSPRLLAARTLPTASAMPAAMFPTGGIANAANGADATDSVFDRVLDFAKTAGLDALHAAQKWVFSGPDDFVQKLAPYAQAVAHKLGVSVRAVLAQAALETGWGKHMPHQADGSNSFNLFGIKAGGSWHGKYANVPTLEFKDGVAVRSNAAFRAYAGPARSFADYARMLTGNPRYADALGHGEDVASFARALHRAGYATDPDYANKLTAIANSDTMRDALASLKDSPSSPTPGS